MNHIYIYIYVCFPHKPSFSPSCLPQLTYLFWGHQPVDGNTEDVLLIAPTFIDLLFAGQPYAGQVVLRGRKKVEFLMSSCESYGYTHTMYA